MKSTTSKIISSFLAIVFLGFFVTPAFAAVECDKDGDGYIVITNPVMKVVAPNVTYDENGNYSSVQWQDFFKMFNAAQLTEDEKCLAVNFKKGAEPAKCDQPIADANSGVYDPSKVTTPVQGSQVNPGSFDVADNGIDEDCNGLDAKLLAQAQAVGGTAEKDIGGLVQKFLSLLSRIVVVVSIAIMVWGGVMYATAAGDEAKTSKARKAIIGAVIGLIIGLLAPSIVNLIAANLA